MNFSSLSFIFLFLPLFVLVHAVAKGKLRHAVLFLGSLLFYALAIGKQYEWIIILLLSSLVNYILGLLLADSRGRFRKAILVTGVIYNLIVLCLYKYSDVWMTAMMPTMAKLLQVGQAAPNILLPLGLSFYTFKNLSYLHEVYAEKVRVEESYIRYGAYLIVFPQISMGPIQTYESFHPYLDDRKVTLAGINNGAVDLTLFSANSVTLNGYRIICIADINRII